MLYYLLLEITTPLIVYMGFVLLESSASVSVGFVLLESSPLVSVGFVLLDLGSFVDNCLSFCSFLLAIVFSVLRITDSDYPFGIYKLFFGEDGTPKRKY